MRSSNRTFSIAGAYPLWNTVFLLTILVYAAGLFITIMEPDAAVYAEIAMEMHDSGNFFSIYHKGADWLDKPHFPFWMSALSYSVFGVSAFAYKLPGVLFTLLGARYTFLFARRFYSARHGYIAALILLTAQHIIISNQDVRAEPFMTGLLIMALYHLTRLPGLYKPGAAHNDSPEKMSRGYWLLHLSVGSLALACLIMTKGLFTIIPVAAGIGLSLLYSQNWKAILHWQWLLCAALTLVFLSPSLYGYYQQFDLHPEKKIFGQQQVSGVEFFLWTSQWGRFTNTGPIKGKGDVFFFVHTTLWAFLPWAFLGFFALYQKTREIIRRTASTENYTYFGFIMLFLIFSVSKFQLSFYLNPIFSLLSILSAAALLQMTKKAARVFSVMHLVLCCLLVVALCLLHFFFMNGLPHVDTLLILVSGMGLSLYLFLQKGKRLKKILFATALITLSVNYYVNRDFYPALLKYQSESEAGYYIRSQGIPAEDLVFTGDIRSVQDIILHHTVPVIPTDSLTASALSGKYVYTDSIGISKIDSLKLHSTLVKTFDDFHVTMLTGKFINRKTRPGAVKKNRLLKVD